MTQPFRFRPGAEIPTGAWTERVSNICAMCGGSVDTDEHEDLTEVHPEDCPGCPLCEIGVRLFKVLPDGRVFGIVFHPPCFESLIDTQRRTPER